jgi:hypothetical protein
LAFAVNQRKGADNMRKSVITVGGLFALVLGGGALSFAATVSPPPPQVQMYKDIPYLSGGVGLAERATLRELGREDNLKLVFAQKQGIISATSGS